MNSIEQNNPSTATAQNVDCATHPVEDLAPGAEQDPKGGKDHKDWIIIQSAKRTGRDSP